MTFLPVAHGPMVNYDVCSSRPSAKSFCYSQDSDVAFQVGDRFNSEC